MKTTRKLFFIAMLFISLVSNAQMQVRTDGSVWQGYSGYANLFLGTYMSGGTDNGQWGIEVLNGGLNFWKPYPSPNSGNYMLYIAQNGNVGVGKVPSAKLDVNGNIAIYGTVRLSSDERLKTNIAQLTDSETNKLYLLNAKSYIKHQPEDKNESVKKAKGVSANSAKNFSKTVSKTAQATEYGFLAQELMTVYPDLVTQDSAGYYLVDYIGLIPVLVEAIKEQKIVIDQLSLKVNGSTSSSSSPKKVAASSTTSNTSLDPINYPLLDQNTPNPFNTQTSINFYLPLSVGSASIYIYDMNGTQLKSYSISERGKGVISIQATEFSAGMYLYSLITDGKVIDTKRMILTK